MGSSTKKPQRYKEYAQDPDHASTIGEKPSGEDKDDAWKSRTPRAAIGNLLPSEHHRAPATFPPSGETMPIINYPIQKLGNKRQRNSTNHHFGGIIGIN